MFESILDLILMIETNKYIFSQPTGFLLSLSAMLHSDLTSQKNSDTSIGQNYGLHSKYLLAHAQRADWL